MLRVMLFSGLAVVATAHGRAERASFPLLAGMDVFLFVVFAWLAYRNATLRITVDLAGVEVRNQFRSQWIPWSDVRALSTRRVVMCRQNIVFGVWVFTPWTALRLTGPVVAHRSGTPGRPSLRDQVAGTTRKEVGSASTNV